MEISYKTKKLEKLLKNDSELIKKYGDKATNKIVQRMQELDAAENLSDMPPAARTHPYKPKNSGKFSVDILKHKHSLRLLFHAKETSDFLDRTNINKVEILEIVKIHS